MHSAPIRLYIDNDTCFNNDAQGREKYPEGNSESPIVKLFSA